MRFLGLVFVLCLAVQGVAGAQTNRSIPTVVTQVPWLNPPTVLTSSSATACTSIETTNQGMLGAVINANTSAQSVTLNLYDEGASPSCASADLRYSATLGASQVVILNIPLFAGLAYSLSSAAANNIVIYRI